MKVSLNVIKQLVDFELPPVDQLVARVNAQLGGVEEIIELGERYKDARIVRVVACDKHPDADRLSVCLIDDGGVADVERDEQGLVQVVCGAPNVRAGLWAIWLPPGAVVPSSFDDAEPFVLGARKLRGVISNGMLAAADELNIGTDHDGIIEITEHDLKPSEHLSEERGASEQSQLRPGASFAEVFGLDDTIIDIENKMFTHRPDLFGQLGVAREIAGILGEQFVSPDWYLSRPHFAGGSGLPLEIFNDAPEKAPRFMAVALKNVEIKPSPLWLQCALVTMGGKPINNVVDATNYVMLMSAQPTHAYDYDRLRGHKLGVRMANRGETIELINGKTYQLDQDDIVIADGAGAIGLAGVMGGLDSEVTSQTKNIVLEVASFDMYAIRKTAMRHGLFTDAVTRFNKGQSPLQNPYVLGLLRDMIGGELASEVFDLTNERVRQALPANELYPPLSVAPRFICERLGADIAKAEMCKMLGNVEFVLGEDGGARADDGSAVTGDGDARADDGGDVPGDGDARADDAQNAADDLHIAVPFWRTDIEQPEDIVEEIGRLYGFDKLPRQLPLRHTKPAPKNPSREIKQLVRESLRRSGANEVLTYSFVHENVLKKAELDASQAFQLSNALSPDLQYYRLSVLPSLLTQVHANIKAGHDEFVLFEIGKGHNKKYHADDDDGLPRELKFVDAVYASKKPRQGAPYFYVRRLLQQLCLDLGFTVQFNPVKQPIDFPVTAPFELSRSAFAEAQDGTFVGMVGELKQSVVRNFKLPTYAAAMTLDLSGLQKASEKSRQTYQPLSKYPSTTQDISLKSATNVAYRDLHRAVERGIARAESGFRVSVKPLDIYAPSSDATTKTTTFRLIISSDSHTLTDADVKPIMDSIASVALSELEAERI